MHPCDTLRSFSRLIQISIESVARRSDTRHVQILHLQRNIRPLASPVASSGSLTLIAETSDECKSGMLPRYWYRSAPSAPQIAPALWYGEPLRGTVAVSCGNGKRHRNASVLRAKRTGGQEWSSTSTSDTLEGARRICWVASCVRKR